MPAFRINSTQAVWATWTYEIEAKSEEDAIDKLNNGDHGEPIAGPEIGDGIDGYDLIVEPAI